MLGLGFRVEGFWIKGRFWAQNVLVPYCLPHGISIQLRHVHQSRSIGFFLRLRAAGLRFGAGWQVGEILWGSFLYDLTAQTELLVSCELR